MRKILEQNWQRFIVLLLGPGTSEESEGDDSPSETGRESTGRLLALAIPGECDGSLQPACW